MLSSDDIFYCANITTIRPSYSLENSTHEPMQPNDKLSPTKTTLSVIEIETSKAKKIAKEEKEMLGNFWED